MSKLPLDYKVQCPQCGSDDIFTMHDTPITTLPVRAIRQCRKCGYKFYTKFDKYTTDVRQLAEATVFKSIESDVWTGVFVSGIYDTKEEAVEAQIAELVSECTK